MRVLVTGGTGFIGSHLIEHLRATGDQVRALVRPGSNRAFLDALGAAPATGNLDDQASLDAACDGCEIVYHAAARVEIHGSEAEFFNTTVAGTRRLVQAANRAGVRRFVQISSCGVYHPKLMRAGRVIDESTPSPDPPPWFVYGRAKLHAERVVQNELAPEAEWVVIRLGYVYGPRNRTMHTHLAPLLARGAVRIIGRGDNEMAMIYVLDAVKAIALAGRRARAARQILIAGPVEFVTQQHYFDALADGFGLPRIRRHVPYWLAFAAGRIAELFESAARPAIVRRSAIALTGLPQRIDSRRTREILGWQPEMGFDEGIRRAFDWYHATFGAVDSRQPAIQAS